MRLSVISPHSSNNGNTSLSMLIALELANTGRTTCITHIKPMSDSFFKYLNFIGYEDKTSTPSQIVKILREGGLSKDDVTDYCKKVGDNLEAFTNNSTNFNQDDMNFMIKYIAESFPHEHVIFDVDDNDIQQVANVAKLSDVIVLNITQSIAEQHRFFVDKEKYIKILDKTPVIVVVNKYNSIKGTLKETAKWMGIKKPNNWLVLHENPWIAWATNNGKLNQLYKKMKEKDSRVIELNSDIGKICNNLIKANMAKDKRSGGRG